MKTTNQNNFLPEHQELPPPTIFFKSYINIDKTSFPLTSKTLTPPVSATYHPMIKIVDITFVITHSYLYK